MTKDGWPYFTFVLHIQKSLREGVLPVSWKDAIITPKKGSKKVYPVTTGQYKFITSVFCRMQ